MPAMPKPSNPDFLNGVPELLVLHLLARTPMHGYEVVRAIAAETGERLTFGEGSIYPVLHRLERGGLLSSKREEVGNRSRIVYRVTAAGKKRLSASAAAWAEVVTAVTRVLHGGTDAPPAVA